MQTTAALARMPHEGRVDMRQNFQRRGRVLSLALVCALAGCGGVIAAAPAVRPAALAELDRAAAGQGVLGSADYTRARDVLSRMQNTPSTPATARILGELRATALVEQDSVARMDAADLIRRALELDRQRAGVQP